MIKERILNWVAWGAGTLPLLVSCNAAETLNNNSWILTAVYYGLLFIFTILVPKITKLIKVIVEAKKDGKITKEELNDIIDNVTDIIKDTKDAVDDIKDIKKK